MWKKLMYLFISFSIIVFLIILGCFPDNDDIHQPSISQLAINHINEMGFITSYYLEGERIISSDTLSISLRINPEHPQFNPIFTELIFFMNAEEANDHPPNVIAAWPNADMIPGLIEGFHWAVERTGPFGQGSSLFDRSSANWECIYKRTGLSYPFTKENFVYDWNWINGIWWSFLCYERYIILHASLNGYLPNYIYEKHP